MNFAMFFTTRFKGSTTTFLMMLETFSRAPTSTCLAFVTTRIVRWRNELDIADAEKELWGDELRSSVAVEEDVF